MVWIIDLGVDFYISICCVDALFLDVCFLSAFLESVMTVFPLFLTSVCVVSGNHVVLEAGRL